MNEHAVNNAPFSAVDDDAPPPDTAIVRPLRHVRAVRERHMQQLAERSLGPESRSARAWSWTLGETNLAPITEQVTAVPPGRPDIDAQIAVAEERRLGGDRENRADGALTILRWLIGEDDHVPVRGPNPGELVDGFDDVVRPLDQIREVVTTLAVHQDQLRACETHSQPGDADYLNGVTATLRWVGHTHAAAPISGLGAIQVTTRDLKTERVHAEDVIEQLANPGVGHVMPRMYGVGVRSAINWLLGDSTTLNLPALYFPWTNRSSMRIGP